MRILHDIDAMVSFRTWIFLWLPGVDTYRSRARPAPVAGEQPNLASGSSNRPGEPIMTNQVAGVWRLRSAERTAHGNTSDWFGAHPDGLLIFTDSLHFTEAITRTDLPLAASGDRLSTTPEENRARTGHPGFLRDLRDQRRRKPGQPAHPGLDLPGLEQHQARRRPRHRARRPSPANPPPQHR